MSPIDAVISWVDGYDPAYRQKLSDFCASQGVKQNDVVEPTRIQQKNEIYYCLQGLKNHAPWLRTIYIITNEQIPPAIESFRGTPFGQKIKIIDQNDLLKQHAKPTPIFNSISVEWLIWLIPGLSEQFLYLNDDFFIIKDVKPEDFFVKNKSIFSGKWKVQRDKKLSVMLRKKIWAYLGKKIKSPDSPHRAWQEKSAQLMGWRRYFYLLPHAPFPLDKHTFTAFNQSNPDLFYENLQFPFRHENQTSSVPLMAHKDINEDRIIFDKDRSVMVNGECHSLGKIKNRLKVAENNPEVFFLCIQSIDQAPPETQSFMLNWLERTMTTADEPG